MYISEDSGHHCASMAVEKALHEISPRVETLSINAFNYTNPILEKVISKAYLGVVKRAPELWDYLYDNPKVVEKTRRLRELIHNVNSPKLRTLLDEFKPDAVICTQAFPCGMIADCKRTNRLTLPLVGVLTDYAPHAYWLYDNVDYYIVPSEEVGRRFVSNGVSAERVKPLGIPIDPKFKEPVERDAVKKKLGLDGKIPIVLIMGGTQGLGPIRELAAALDASPLAIQQVIVCGTNKRMYRRLSKKRATFKKRTIVYGFTSTINELMAIASVIVSKPGGMTTAEAQSQGLPMVLLRPLPGQEALNTAFLLREGVAVKVHDTQHCVAMLRDLLENEDALRSMRQNAKRCSKPDSGHDIAHLLLELAG